MAQVGDLLDITYPRGLVKGLIAAATFENMKADASRFTPGGGTGFLKSDTGFFDSGTSGKWHGVLTEREVAAYRAIMDAALTPAQRDWLEYGSEAH